MKLDSPIETVTGVGPAYARALKRHGIETVLDLIKFTPLRYLDFSSPIPISNCQAGKMVVVEGEIVRCVTERTPRRHMFIVKATIKDDSGQVECVWFNQLYLKNKLTIGLKVRLSGLVVIENKSGLVLRSPIIQYSSESKLERFYGERTGIKSGAYAHLIDRVKLLIEMIEDPLPMRVLKKHNLPDLATAYKEVHLPENMEDVIDGKHRLAVDELWTLMVLTAKTKKNDTDGLKAEEIKIDQKMLKNDIQHLPFTLTAGQNTALESIASGVESRKPMRRLLNGDVGSGKTVVAFLVAKQAYYNNQSTVILAPTTVLVAQHYQNWRQLFPEVPHFLFTAGLNMYNGEKISRQQAVEKLSQSGPSFICGTHAVFQADIHLHQNVGLVIVDEQHRFGVLQRAHLINKATNAIPHMLSMSATPIPRTAALVLYGDLDVSVLPDKPVGREKIITRLASENSRSKVYQFIDQLIEKGQQAYVICPLIGLDESDESQADGRLTLIEERKALLDEHKRLSGTVFAHRRVGLLHGRMKQSEKDDVLNQFKDGDLDILLSTSVVEVGVDVSNATAMVIESAEFFGLAQLHQLRGRIGRGLEQSYCFLFASDWNPNTKKRLDLLVEYDDGFKLAEKDLELRGPGEIYGTIQAGYTPFKFASLGNMNLVETARKIADDVLAVSESEWSEELRQWIKQKSENIHIE